MSQIVVAVVCVQAFINHLDESNWNKPAEFMQLVDHHFGTVQKGVLTLFQTVTGGVLWETVYQLLEEAAGIQAGVVIFYIFFYNLVFFNIVTSVFVEKGKDLAQVDHDASMMDRRRKDEQLIGQIAHVFASQVKKMGANHQKVTRAVFEAILDSHDVLDFFAAHSLDIQEALLFYNVLVSKVPEGYLSLEVIAEGCVKLKGLATSLDLLTVMFDVQALATQQRSEYEMLHNKLDVLTRNVTALTTMSPAGLPPASKRVRSALQTQARADLDSSPHKPGKADFSSEGPRNAAATRKQSAASEHSLLQELSDVARVQARVLV